MSFLSVFLLFFPAFAANAAPVVVKNIPGLKSINMPIHEKSFGENKTWRGLIAGITIAMIFAPIEFLFLSEFLPITAGLEKSILIGFLLGAGALAGDLIESIVKRKLGKKPGEAFPFWDGTDYIFGALLFLSPIYFPSILIAFGLILIAPLLSLLSNSFSYMMGWKEVWY